MQVLLNLLYCDKGNKKVMKLNSFYQYVILQFGFVLEQFLLKCPDKSVAQLQHIKSCYNQFLVLTLKP